MIRRTVVKMPFGGIGAILRRLYGADVSVMAFFERVWCFGVDFFMLLMVLSPLVVFLRRWQRGLQRGRGPGLPTRLRPPRARMAPRL